MGPWRPWVEGEGGDVGRGAGHASTEQDADRTTGSRQEVNNATAITYSGGVSVAEYRITNVPAGTLQTEPQVEFQRGPDMGGGVGGLLYSLRSGDAKFNLSNGRGDIVAQSDSSGTLTWTASYEAYGKRPMETGGNGDRQRANSKEEDPTGLLNEGFRYRDLETGTWLSRDPAGFVDGPNLYAYVRQNPWTSFDPEGLYQHIPAPILLANGIDPTRKDYQQGSNQGSAKVAKIGLAAAVGAGVTFYTGGVAGPLIAKASLGATSTTLATVGVSGAAGGYATQVTSNALNDRPLNENAGTAALLGATLNMAGAVLAQSMQMFQLGFRESKAIHMASTLAKRQSANPKLNGASNVMISSNGQVSIGFSKNAGNGPVSASIEEAYGTTRTTCAEARTLTTMEKAGIEFEGSVSAAATVNLSKFANGTPMKACPACNPVLSKFGIGDAVSGSIPRLAPAAFVPVPTLPLPRDESSK